MFTTSHDGVRIWWEEEGSGPAVLLIPGRGDPTDVFPRRFSDGLVAAGCRVVRFDPRDTGLSGDGGDTYTMTDMADDELAVLDAAGAERAHLVGLSMGGLHVVDLASRRPDRVASITFLSAMSPSPEAGMGPDFFLAIDDREEGIVHAMGETTEADRAWVAAELGAAAERALERPDAGEKHQAAAFRFGWPEPERLAEIVAPALVVHGDADRVLPVAHGEAFRDGIAGAELLIVTGMGHLPHPAEWDRVAERTATLALASAG